MVELNCRSIKNAVAAVQAWVLIHRTVYHNVVSNGNLCLQRIELFLCIHLSASQVKNDLITVSEHRSYFSLKEELERNSCSHFLYHDQVSVVSVDAFTDFLSCCWLDLLM